FNYKIYNRNAKYMWIVGLDYEYFNWSKLTMNNKSANLRDSKQYSFGLQFIPDASDSRGFLKIIRYRVGVKYKDTRIALAGTQLADISGSAGFGIPLVRSKSVYPTSSTIDIGVEVGSRGTIENGLLKEQYTNIYVGFSFSPNFWDRWFKKRKIN
ncbi:MAG: hypothetical protein VSS52_003420, partial [Thiotrichaceae bacterium]|nr:hypothetical protein [Thiotrichaceae bacterium]